MHDIRILRGSSEEELRACNDLFNLFKNSPIPGEELLSNLGLYSNRQLLPRILSIHEVYLKIIHVHGVIMKFGVRWGQNLALFSSFRGIYEPFNYNRKDELNCPEFPGETQALEEVFGLDKYAIKRSPLDPLISYIVIE